MLKPGPRGGTASDGIGPGSIADSVSESRSAGRGGESV